MIMRCNCSLQYEPSQVTLPTLCIFAYINKTCTAVSRRTALQRLQPYSCCTFQYAPLMSAMIPTDHMYVWYSCSYYTSSILLQSILFDTPPHTVNSMRASFLHCSLFVHSYCNHRTSFVHACFHNLASLTRPRKL